MRTFERLKLTVFLACFYGTLVSAGNADQVSSKIQQNDQSVGIDGYSPVSYFQRNKAEKGNSTFHAEYRGITYHFTDQEQLNLFKQSPEQYVPAHGGWCSLMLSGSGNLTPANPEAFKIVDGKLLLFWSGGFKGQMVSGLDNWNSKTKNKPAKDSKRLKKADKAWAKVLSGDKQPVLLVFSPSDNQKLSSYQREKARKQY